MVAGQGCSGAVGHGVGGYVCARQKSGADRAEPVRAPRVRVTRTRFNCTFASFGRSGWLVPLTNVQTYRKDTESWFLLPISSCRNDRRNNLACPFTVGGLSRLVLARSRSGDS